MLPLALIWYFAYRRMGQAGTGVMSIGKSKAREIAGEMTGVKFEDVGGVDEVEVEVKEIIEFLKEPDRFTRLGAKLPKGVLLTTKRHGGRRKLLHGEDVLEVDDVIFALAEPQQVEELKQLFRAR